MGRCEATTIGGHLWLREGGGFRRRGRAALPTPVQTESLTVLSRGEAVAVPAAAAIPEASTLSPLRVEGPVHRVVLTRTHLLAQGAAGWSTRDGRRSFYDQ